jgi:hypothetical protein
VEVVEMSTFRERLSDLARTTSVLAWVAFSVTVAFLGLAGLMVAGYTLTDPGGWTGLGLTALWAVPALGLVALAFYRPDTAIPVLAVAALAPLGFGVWTLVDYDGARGWEDQHGPVSLVLVLAVGLPLAVEGLSRPTPAGLMMLGITVVPLLLSIVGAGSDWGQALSIGLLAAPVVVGGVLFVLAGRSRTGPEADTGPPRVLTGR